MLWGQFMKKKGFIIKRKNDFLRAIQFDKDLVEAKINIATLYQLEGNEEKANEIFNDLAKEKTDNAEVLYRRSTFAFKQEKFEEGWRYYEYRWKAFPLNKTSMAHFTE